MNVSVVVQLTAHLTMAADKKGTFHPSWSPDGTQILFTHDPGVGGYGDLFIIDRDGTGLHVVAQTVLAEDTLIGASTRRPRRH